jgi:hypothetical protein
MRPGQKPPPTVGERYRFTDFVGATFVATFAGYHTTDEGLLHLDFEDHGAFETNLPIDYEAVPL